MPINFTKKFEKSGMQAHYYVFNHLFIDYEDALNFTVQNDIPLEFIIRTKYYVS